MSVLIFLPLASILKPETGLVKVGRVLVDGLKIDDDGFRVSDEERSGDVVAAIVVLD